MAQIDIDRITLGQAGRIRKQQGRRSAAKVSRVTAIHEAAHAIAMCRYELGFHEIHVRARAEIIDLPNSRRGDSGHRVYGTVTPVCHAFANHRVTAASIDAPIFDHEIGGRSYRAQTYDLGVRFMLSTYAGPAAQRKQAHHSNFDWHFTLFRLEQNKDLVRKLKLSVLETLDDPIPNCDELDYLKALYFLAPEDERKRERIRSAVNHEVASFLRDKHMWAAIHRLADLLQARGDLDCEDDDVRAIADSIPRMGLSFDGGDAMTGNSKREKALNKTTAITEVAFVTKLGAAKHALAKASEMPDIIELIDHAEAVRAAAKAKHISAEGINAWTRFVVDAERKAWARIKAMREAGELGKQLGACDSRPAS